MKCATSREVFEFVLGFTQLVGKAPTLRDIARAFGFSRGTSWTRVRQLEDAGLVRRTSGGVAITRVGRDIFRRGIYRLSDHPET